MPDIASAMKKAGIGRLTDRPAAANVGEATLVPPTDGNRVGRAPYNFVPPPMKLRLDATIPPAADRYHDKHNSGAILLKITAETDFYIRGVWELKHFVNPSSNTETDVKDQMQPFFQGRRLPGSSLRGLIRSLVEVLTDAPLDPLSRQRFAFRTLGASAETSSKTFEPCHRTWATRIRKARGGYAIRVDEANPAPRPSPSTGWDLAQAIFGRLKSKRANGARSRVFFEDAFLTAGDVSKTERIETVFGEPKPTTFQHYLQQRSWLQQDSIPWSRDGQPPEQARLRGLKMYWHRKKQISMADKSGKTPDRREKQNTVFKKVLVDPSRRPVFTAKIRFENLTDVELGALLCALELPKGLRHHLGLAKPFGLGVIHSEVDKVLVTNPHARYSAFVETVPDLSGAEMPATLVEGFEGKTVAEFQKEFAKTWHEKDTVESLWEIPRFQELKALLAWDDLPLDAEIWNNMTRYLAFGQLQGPSTRFDYNEYVRVGHGEIGFPPLDRRGKANPQQERRRPLPAATEVLRDARNTDGGVLPRDKRPDYIKPAGGGRHHGDER